MNRLLLLYFLFSLSSCSIDRTIIEISENENKILMNFQNLQSESKLIIADKNEPGEKLILCLTFIDKASKKALSNQPVSFYHTSTYGDYEPSNINDETTARLNGTTKTDKAGKIYVETILPGDYGSAEDNRHIHTNVYGAHPEPYDIFFKQYSSRTGKFMNSGNDQMFYAFLKKTTDNILICFVTIEVKNPKVKD